MFPNSPAASTKPARIRSTAASSLPATRADPDDPKQWKLWLVTSSVKKVNRALKALLKAPTSPSKAFNPPRLIYSPEAALVGRQS